MPAEKDRASLLAENRRLRKENEYLSHRVAYIEALSQLIGFDLGKTVRKKRFEAIDTVIETRERPNVMLLCAIADVSRKCYYHHRARLGIRDPKLDAIIVFIRNVQEETFHGVGYRHMTARIRRELGFVVNEKRILAIMKANDLLSVVRRKKYAAEVYVRRRELQASIPGNLLKGHFFSCIPGKVFITDITFLYCLEQVLYLNSIVDLFNREVVAWLVGEHPEVDLCVRTRLMLSDGREMEGSIIHSDRGSGYLSWEDWDLIKQQKARQSCTKTGKCWENANMEFFIAY